MRIVTGLLQVAAAALLAADARAGVVFDFAAEAPGYSYSGTMTLEGPNSRLDISAGNHLLFNPAITHITRKEGAEIFVVDHSRRSYFHRLPPPEMRGPLSTTTGIGSSRLVRSHVTRSRSKPEGGRIERHLIRAEYSVEMDVDGEKLDAVIHLEVEVDADPGFEQRAFPWGLQYAAKTGFEKLDWALASRIPNRLPVRQVVRASRQIAGGPLMTETITITVSNVREADAGDGIFYPPPGYRYEEPVFRFGQ